MSSVPVLEVSRRVAPLVYFRGFESRGRPYAPPDANDVHARHRKRDADRGRLIATVPDRSLYT
jgi:hypothetical protein